MTFVLAGSAFFIVWGMIYSAYFISASNGRPFRISKFAVYQSQLIKYVGLVLIVVGLVKGD